MKKIRFPKRLTAVALAAVIAAAPAAAAFTDTEGHWAEESINKWSQEYGLLGGYDDGSFQPDASITRGAFAGILDRFMKYQAASSPDTFSDTAGNYWEQAILKLHAAGVYGGNQGKALAGNSITRQQAVTMIARAFKIEAEVIVLPYKDVEDIAEYAQSAVGEFTVRGYIDDCADGYFRPTEPITRAEFINILDNMIQALVQTTEEVSQDVAGNLMINSVDGASLREMNIQGDLIVAPGVAGEVKLTNVSIGGRIRSFSGVEITMIEEKPEEPEKPAEPLQPGDIYTPGTTTGETIVFEGKPIPIYADAERSRLKAEDFIWNGDRIEYIGDEFETRFGIDVSAYQNRSRKDQTIDWEAVAADGVDFAMIRIGLRGTSVGTIYADQFYAENIDGAMAAGLETGVYFFAQAITVEEAIEEAEFVLSLLKDHEINGPVVYDWEMKDSSYRVHGTSREMATACAIAFCQTVERAGYTPMIYASNYVNYIKYDQGAIAQYLSWFPEYKSENSEHLGPTLYYQPDYWQFTDRCVIDGITDQNGRNKVDANLQFIPK